MADPAWFRELIEQLTLSDVRELFSEYWILFHSGERWCAIRRGGGEVAWDGPQSMILPALHAARLADLAMQLCVQTILRQLTDDELAHVWTAGEMPAPTHPAHAPPVAAS